MTMVKAAMALPDSIAFFVNKIISLNTRNQHLNMNDERGGCGMHGGTEGGYDSKDMRGRKTLESSLDSFLLCSEGRQKLDKEI